MFNALLGVRATRLSNKINDFRDDFKEGYRWTDEAGKAYTTKIDIAFKQVPLADGLFEDTFTDWDLPQTVADNPTVSKNEIQAAIKHWNENAGAPNHKANIDAAREGVASLSTSCL